MTVAITELEVHAALQDAGIHLLPTDIRIEQREDRWLASLPGERLAWFPANARGRDGLDIERRVVRLLAERCSFQAPRILFESDQGWDVRLAVPGACVPWDLYRRIQKDAALARRVGGAIGSILIDQHMRIFHDDVADWLPLRPEWPEPTDTIRQHVPEVIDDYGLLAEIDQTLTAYDAVTVATEDGALVHGDLGLHNIAVDPETSEVRGVFDYVGASWSDRHHDFRYLLFDQARDDMLEAALAVYEPAVGRALNRDRIRLYNAACAIGFLAFRRGVPPDQPSCGRTLAEDLRWVGIALARL
jgi:hypothetical protein